jgi:hypothetical protein
LHPLDGAIAKVNRAREHIEALSEAIQSTVKGYRYRVVVAERDTHHPGYRALRIETQNDLVLPISWSVIVGEVAHDLRSALELLAYQLLLLNQPTSRALTEVTFPIRIHGPRSSKSKPDRWGKNAARLFKREHMAMIQRLQPYHRKNGKRRNHLWLLHEVNRADKHRLIQLASVAMARIEAQRVTLMGDPNDRTYTPMVGNLLVRNRVPFKDSAKVGRIETLDTQHNVQVNVAVAAEVVFLQGCKAVQGFPVITVLHGAANTVSRVLQLAHGEFVP